jgi:hypothetical protein
MVSASVAPARAAEVAIPLRTVAREPVLGRVLRRGRSFDDERDRLEQVGQTLELLRRSGRADRRDDAPREQARESCH